MNERNLLSYNNIILYAYQLVKGFINVITDNNNCSIVCVKPDDGGEILKIIYTDVHGELEVKSVTYKELISEPIGKMYKDKLKESDNG